MSFLAALAPYAGAIAGGTMTAGTLVGGIQRSQADRYNATVMGQEQTMAANQASAQAGMVQREGRIALGKQVATFGGAGVGYGGSSYEATRESSINQELDVLNTKYKGSVAGYGYGVQSSILKSESGQNLNASLLLAGGQALATGAKYYSQPGMPSMSPSGG